MSPTKLPPFFAVQPPFLSRATAVSASPLLFVLFKTVTGTFGVESVELVLDEEWDAAEDVEAADLLVDALSETEGDADRDADELNDAVAAVAVLAWRPLGWLRAMKARTATSTPTSSRAAPTASSIRRRNGGVGALCDIED
jgi:hypothetical protein